METFDYFLLAVEIRKATDNRGAEDRSGKLNFHVN